MDAPHGKVICHNHQDQQGETGEQTYVKWVELNRIHHLMHTIVTVASIVCVPPGTGASVLSFHQALFNLLSLKSFTCIGDPKLKIFIIIWKSSSISNDSNLVLVQLCCALCADKVFSFSE